MRQETGNLTGNFSNSGPDLPFLRGDFRRNLSGFQENSL
jgi:hypothetical protein